MTINNVKYSIQGMDCAGCANTIETFCKKISGIKNVEVNFPKSLLSVQIIDANAQENLEKGMLKIGFFIQPYSNQNNLFNNILKNNLNKQALINTYRKKQFKKIPFRTVKQKGLITKNKSLHVHEPVYKNEWKKIVLLAVFYGLAFVAEFFNKNIGFIIFTAITFIGLFPILKKMKQFIQVRYFFSVELLMTISLIGAIIIGAAEEASAVIILYMIGETLEGYTANKARSGIKSLASLIPEEANIILKNGQIKKIKVDNIQVDQNIEIKAGERFPVDGLVLDGSSFVDESLLTGESFPILKNKNDNVFAGSINNNGCLIVQAKGVGNNNSVFRLIKMVEDAQGSKTNTMRTIEKFSRYYTPIILFLGILIAVVPTLLGLGTWSIWIYRGLSILLIACPCALIISTPAAIASGITSASRMGILIKNAAAIEIIGRVKTIAFDKTGTITQGKLKLVDIVSLSQEVTLSILKITASIEAKSNHPLALAINAYASEKNIELESVSQIQEIAGQGISGIILNRKYTVCSFNYADNINLLNQENKAKILNYQRHGKIISLLIAEGQLLGFLALQDILKPNSAQALKILFDKGIRNLILTGDNKETTNAITYNLNATVLSELMPEQKLFHIREYAAQGKIAMVGDGINDAPALAAADVGIAMGAGTNVAIDSAQIVLMQNCLSSVIDAINISKKTLNNITQNIAIAIGIKLIFLILTLFGSTMLWEAILADTGSTVIVTLNAMRLLLVKKVSIN